MENGEANETYNELSKLRRNALYFGNGRQRRPSARGHYGIICREAFYHVGPLDMSGVLLPVGERFPVKVPGTGDAYSVDLCHGWKA